MKYVGSKNRLAKELAPIIQSYVDNPLCVGYIEPFVGGANMIDKIKCKRKYGCDTHKYLIALLTKVRDDVDDLPDTYNEAMYKAVKEHPENYEDWFVGLVGFCFFGAKWFGGFPRGFKEDKVTPRDIVAESIRNLKKQAPNLKDTSFLCKDFRSMKENTEGYVIYCDPPYRDTTKYATGNFPYDEFYDWCRKFSKNNIVLISDYWMPDDFECVWQKEVKTSLDNNRGADNDKTNRVEKLWKWKGEK